MVPFIVAVVLFAGLALIIRKAYRQPRVIVMALPGSLRCSTCGINWPRLMENGKPVFQPCPECEGKTDMVTAAPIGVDDAARRKLYAEFERYCEKRDAERLRADLDAFDSFPSQEKAA